MSESLKAPGLYANLPFADYLADPCEAPSLTSSLAKTLLERSPTTRLRRTSTRTSPCRACTSG